MSRVMLIIATGQNAANIQPLSEPSLKPDFVCIAVTKEMEKHYEELKNQIGALGIKVETPLHLHQELNINALEDTFSNWLLNDHADDEVLVNLAGGLKTITVAAYKTFSALGAKVFYAHYDGQIVWLDAPLDTALRITPNIRLAAYLKIYQYEINNKQSIADVALEHKKYSQELATYLRHNFDARCSAISHLNWLAKPIIVNINQYERSLTKHKSNNKQPALYIDNPKSNPQVDELYQAIPYIENVFSINSKRLTFNSIESAKIVAGAWLDILVAETLRQLSELNFRDISVNVSFSKSTQRQGKQTYNELDVMALYGTNLLIVECKTINWDNNKDASPLESIYKLAALADIGGLNTHALFVSLYELPANAKTRAAENNITVIDGKKLVDLSSLIKQGITSA